MADIPGEIKSEAAEVAELKMKLAKRNEDLSRARFRLRKAKAEIVRLKEIVTYQRGRILELHE
jgi:hypothetical protein